MEFSLSEIVQGVGGKLIRGSSSTLIGKLSTDSRSINPGEVFCALQGLNYNGEKFISDALDKGAKGVISTNWDSDLEQRYPQAFFVKVSDSIKALGDIAHLKRSHFPGKVVLVSGSSGKTSTKNIISYAFHYLELLALATEKNQNNLIGLPQTLLRIQDNYAVTVLEAGMNQPGELYRLTEIADPDIAILTNVGIAHVGCFPSKEALVQAKADMWRVCKDKTIFIANADCDTSQRILKELGKNNSVITFGIHNQADVTAHNINKLTPYGYEFEVRIGDKRILTRLNIPVPCNIYNALASLACIHGLGLSVECAGESLTHFQSEDMRSVVQVVNGVTFIIDCYNSNPDSMKSALEGLADYESKGRKFACLGDMLELGHEELKYHADIGKLFICSELSGLYTLGERARSISQAAKQNPSFSGETISFSEPDLLIRHLNQTIRKGDCILFKASRLMKFEQIVVKIMQLLKHVRCKRPEGQTLQESFQ